MNKEQALQRLSAIEKETAELKKIIEAKDCPTVFQGRLLSNEDNQEHWYVSVCGQFCQSNHYCSDLSVLGLAFGTREVLEQHVKHLHLMQEARIAMAEDWGNTKVDWSKGSRQTKYCIEFFNGGVATIDRNNAWNPVHFRTEQACEEFFKKYTQEELKLMIMGVL